MIICTGLKCGIQVKGICIIRKHSEVENEINKFITILSIQSLILLKKTTYARDIIIYLFIMLPRIGRKLQEFRMINFEVFYRQIIKNVLIFHENFVD